MFFLQAQLFFKEIANITSYLTIFFSKTRKDGWSFITTIKIQKNQIVSLRFKV